MPRVVYIKSGPGAVKGTTRTMTKKSADLLERLGYVRYLTADVRAEAATESVEPTERTKRQYKRRDMTAESA